MLLQIASRDDLIKGFQLMGQGMGGIFVVLIAIALIVKFLTIVTNKSTK